MFYFSIGTSTFGALSTFNLQCVCYFTYMWFLMQYIMLQCCTFTQCECFLQHCRWIWNMRQKLFSEDKFRDFSDIFQKQKSVCETNRGLWSAALSGGAERNCSWCNTAATHLTHTDLCRVIVMWAWVIEQLTLTERVRSPSGSGSVWLTTVTSEWVCVCVCVCVCLYLTMTKHLRSWPTHLSHCSAESASSGL